ncbi:DUF4136 domain-containing protein [Galbibacter mesophilus]|uniref:DUF4136 domain-containing protein n=1 Tax=Galbibacter mesophilus TaxID=379069 RepID=UPI00191EA931|nr:DUF4136 domain-containing protein [Galbibacter mesophilus]MCM5661425.1 DUF4136 domain-containing protein [Galbibacter mesophilus]
MLSIGLLMYSCAEDGPDYVDELDVVYTNYNDDFDFGTTTTYSLPDNVIKVDDETFPLDDGDEPDFIDDEYGDVILSSIASNMDERGWQRVDKDSNPDVIILPAAMSTLNLYYYYDWGYWGWWYPGYFPGWGWWYPGYYPPFITGYRSGTVVLQMTHPDGIGLDDNIPVIWTASINGLFEGSTTSIQERIRNTVDQAFTQSPYLTK